MKKPKKKDIGDGKYRDWWSKDKKKWYIELDNKFDPLIPRVFILTPKWKKDKFLGKSFDEGTFKRKKSTLKDAKEYMKKLRANARKEKRTKIMSIGVIVLALMVFVSIIATPIIYRAFFYEPHVELPPECPIDACGDEPYEAYEEPYVASNLGSFLRIFRLSFI